LSPVWTPSVALDALATPMLLVNPNNWQGIIPFATLNGTSEDMTTPDDTYFTRIGAAFSIRIWVKASDITSVTLMAKWSEVAGAELREWRLVINSASKLALELYDESANVTATRPSTLSIVVDTWTHCIATYDGGDGATAANGINLYINGVLSNGTAVNDAAFVAMENLTTLPRIGSIIVAGGGGGSYYAGQIAGAPLGPAFVQAALTAAQIANNFRVERLAMGV